MTHFLKVKKDKFDTVIEGINFAILRIKTLPKKDDRLVFECTGEQKETIVQDVSGGDGLMKGWYFVQHEMKNTKEEKKSYNEDIQPRKQYQHEAGARHDEFS